MEMRSLEHARKQFRVETTFDIGFKMVAVLTGTRLFCL